MKTALKYWFTFLLVLLMGSQWLVSCKAKAPLQNTTVEKTITSNDTNTVEKTIVNKEILDKIIFQIAKINSTSPDCDSLINYYQEQLASSLTAFKQSGDNQYQLQYNKITKQLEFIAKIGQTENKEKIKTIKTNTKYYLKSTKEIPVHFMKWWETGFMRFGQIMVVAGVIYLIIKFKIV